MVFGYTALKSAAEKVKYSAVREPPPRSAAARLCEPSCEVTAEGDRNRHLSETRNSPESLVLEQAPPGSTAEAEVAATVTDTPVVEAAADRPEPAASEQDTQQLAFVCAVVFIVLKDCGAIGPHTKEAWEVPVERLATQTRDVLEFSDKFCLNKKLIKSVCKAVVKEMKRTFSSAELVSVILTQDPAVESAIIKSIQEHVPKEARRYQQKKKLKTVLRDTLEVIAFIATFVLAFAILGVIF